LFVSLVEIMTPPLPVEVYSTKPKLFRPILPYTVDGRSMVTNWPVVLPANTGAVNEVRNVGLDSQVPVFSNVIVDSGVEYGGVQTLQRPMLMEPACDTKFTKIVRVILVTCADVKVVGSVELPSVAKLNPRRTEFVPPPVAETASVVFEP
jgi:hypothetical protein